MAGTALKLRYKKQYNQAITNNEISAFSDLNSIESSIYSDILNSIVEISLYKKQNSSHLLPSIQELEEEEIPPYYKDKVWEQKGAIDWLSFIHDEKICYLGISSKKDIGSFLLVINEDNIEKNDIFFTREKLNKDRILKNWENYENLFKKIIPYTGEEQRKNY